MSSIKKAFKKAVGQIEDAFKDAGDDIVHAAEQTVETVFVKPAEQLYDQAKRVEDQVKENPVLLAAPLVLIPGVGAMAVGAIGSMGTIGAGLATGLSTVGAGIGSVGTFAGSTLAGAFGGGALATTAGTAFGAGVAHGIGGALIGGTLGAATSAISGEDPLKGAASGAQIGGIAGFGGGVAGSLGAAAGLTGAAGSLTAVGVNAGLTIPHAAGVAAGLVGGIGAGGSVLAAGYDPMTALTAGVTYGAAVGTNAAQDVGSFSKITMSQTLSGMITSPTTLLSLASSFLTPKTGATYEQSVPSFQMEEAPVAQESSEEVVTAPTKSSSDILAFGAGLGDAFTPALAAGYQEPSQATMKTVAKNRQDFSTRTLGFSFAA